MPQIRWRLGTIMAALAFGAMAFSAGMFTERARNRSAEYVRRAASLSAIEAQYARQEAYLRECFEGCRKGTEARVIRGDHDDAGIWKKQVLKYGEQQSVAHEQAAYYAGLKRKYEQASKFPWFVAPDPPSPPRNLARVP